MKHVSLLLFAVALAFSACTTLENRRDLYSPQKVEGPYTRMLSDGIPDPATTEGELDATGTGAAARSYK